jgi:hypothetical protein
MDPEKPGWLKDYMLFREGLPKKEISLGRHPDESLYRIIQPTGIMYGQPVNAVSHPDMDKWLPRSKMKVLLLESMLNSSYLFEKQEIWAKPGHQNIIKKIGDFYIDVYPNLSISKKTLFGRKKDIMEIAEKVIDKRIKINYEQEENFWSRFFNNSLLFVDIYLFGQWIHTGGDKMVVDFLIEEKNILYKTVCEVMAAAAHSNKNIEDEERKLFALFVSSTGLSNEDKRKSLNLFEERLTLQDITFTDSFSWIVKKYFLELASLTIWADKKVEDSEVVFLTDLNSMLGFNEDDFENSMIAVESFVIKHWQELDYLQTKRNFEIVSARFAARLSRMIEKNNHRVVSVIKEDPELCELFKKASVSKLNEQELDKIEVRFLKALKSISSLSIIELPEHFLDYKVIKRIMPEKTIREIISTETTH